MPFDNRFEMKTTIWHREKNIEFRIFVHNETKHLKCSNFDLQTAPDDLEYTLIIYIQLARTPIMRLRPELTALEGYTTP